MYFCLCFNAFFICIFFFCSVRRRCFSVLFMCCVCIVCVSVVFLCVRVLSFLFSVCMRNFFFVLIVCVSFFVFECMCCNFFLSVVVFVCLSVSVCLSDVFVLVLMLLGVVLVFELFVMCVVWMGLGMCLGRIVTSGGWRRRRWVGRWD